jgi:hypothetical protein
LFENKLTLPPTKNTRELDVRQLGWAIWTPASFIFGFENYGELRHRKKNGPGLRYVLPILLTVCVFHLVKPHWRFLTHLNLILLFDSNMPICIAPRNHDNTFAQGRFMDVMANIVP